MNKRVYVVTMPELGWDCVVGVFDATYVSFQEIRAVYNGDEYVIHMLFLDTRL